MAKKDTGYAQYYRRAASVIRIARFALLLAFVIFAVYCIGFFSNNLTEDAVRSVFNSFARSFDDLTPSETEIKIDTDDSSSYIMMHNDLAVVSNTSANLYAFSGDKLLEYDYTYSDAAAVNAGEYLLVYDTKGHELALYNSVAKLFSHEFEYDVKAACVNSLGYFAVVNSEKTYRSGVIVYGPGNENGNRDSLAGGGYVEKFRWMSPDKYILSVALNGNATELACSAVYNKDGAFVTELIVYDIRTGEKKYTAELADTLVMKLGYAEDDGTIYALADGRFLSFGNDLSAKGVSEFSRGNARFFKEKADCFIVAESNNLSGSSMTINVYSYDASAAFELETEEAVLDADIYGSRLYVLYKKRFAVYEFEDGSAKEIASLPINMQYKALRIDSHGRYILVGAKNAVRGSVENILYTE